jgi:hypothetical protein
VESTAAAHRKQADLLLTHLLGSEEDSLHENDAFFRVGIAGPPGMYISEVLFVLLNNVIGQTFLT